MTAAIWAVANPCEQRTTSTLPHKSLDWLHISLRLVGPERFTARDKINSGLEGGRLVA